MPERLKAAFLLIYCVFHAMAKKKQEIKVIREQHS